MAVLHSLLYSGHILQKKRNIPLASGNSIKMWVLPPGLKAQICTDAEHPSVPLHLSDHCAALNTETFLQQSPIMDYTGTASLICCPSLWGFCLYNQAVREKLKNQSTSNPIFSCLLRLQSTPLQICKKN